MQQPGISTNGVNLMDLIVAFPIILPAVFALGVLLFGRQNQTVRHLLSITSPVLTAALILYINFSGIYSHINIAVAPGLAFSLKPEPFGLLFATLSSVLWIFATVYSIGYMAHEHDKNRFFSFFTLCLAVVMGIALSANLFTFYLFYEFLTVCTYPLVIHEQSREAIAAGRKYLVYSFGGAALVLAAIMITYGITGTLEFKAGGLIEPQIADRFPLLPLFFAFFAGFGVKAAVMPLHAWLPAAMVAPTPVSSLLHAVAVVKSGIFAIVRLIYFIFGPTLCNKLGVGSFVPWISVITIIFASLVALRQDNLMRRLAYSTISQLGYIIFGISLLTSYGFQGGLVHIINHAVLKITLFFCAGYILINAKIADISEMRGIGYRIPVVMVCFSIATLGMVGIPLTNGFISKWFLAMGALEGGRPLFVGALLLSSFLNAAYFMPIVITAFFPGKVKNYQLIEKNLYMLIPIAVLAAVSLLFGILPQIPFGLVNPVYTIFYN
jgi:multicomponent Na+:H+ antiporter subunit D